MATPLVLYPRFLDKNVVTSAGIILCGFSNFSKEICGNVILLLLLAAIAVLLLLLLLLLTSNSCTNLGIFTILLKTKTLYGLLFSKAELIRWECVVGFEFAAWGSIL